MDLPGRDEVARFARRYRVDGMDLEDLCQEVYLAILTGEDPDRHLRRLKKKTERRKPRVSYRGSDYDDLMKLPDDNSLQRVCQNIDALIVLIAARQECKGLRDDWLLTQLLIGSGYRELCDEWKCSEDAAWQAVCRFRNEMYPKLYPQEEDERGAELGREVLRG